ncbi:ATP-dependent zinc metalloprotease FtsH [Bacteroidota bacterium]
MTPPNKNIRSQKSDKKNPDKKKFKFSIYYVYAIIAILFLYFFNSNLGQKAKEITMYDFEAMLKSHDVQKIEIINRKNAEIFLKANKISDSKYQKYFTKGLSSPPKKGPHFYFEIDVVIFDKDLQRIQENFTEEEKIGYSLKTRTDHFGNILGYLLPLAIIIGIWIFFFRRMSGGSGGGGGAGGNIFNVGKSKAQIFNKEENNINIDFKDVAGLQEAKIEVMEIVDFLKKPQKYTLLGGKIPKGALLVGPPGTGKTLLAKAVAGEANVPFFSMSGSDFVEMFVGVGASRVRDLFKQAKAKAPCIIFIDEIDAIGRARGRNANFGSNDERENTLNQLLTEMDGFGSNTGVIIMAATNRADILDNALMRAGRFDRQIHLELPDLNERREIFQVHLRPIKYNKEIDIEFFAKQTPGFSGADIANVCNESALIAARNNKKQVDKQDFLDAVDRIIGGLEKRNKIITKEEKKAIAYHEAGHATISWLLKYAQPLIKVTIIPRGKALGAAWYLPEERHLTTTEQIMDEMCAALGGRAAEELTFGKISTGALNDLEKVTKQAYAMVAFFGMSKKIGNSSFYDSSGQNEYSFQKPYSEKTAEIIDQEASKLISQAYERAKILLNKNKKGHIALGELLLEKEVIFAEDLEKIFGKRDFGKIEIIPESKIVKKAIAKKPTKKVTTKEKKIAKTDIKK